MVGVSSLAMDCLNVYLRLVRHIAFFFIALTAGMIGVFTVGLRLTGDNPGALFGGMACFFFSFLVLVGLEALWVGRLFREAGWWRPAVEVLISVLAVFGAILAVERFFWVGYDFFGEGWEMMLFTFAFLAIDALLYWLMKRSPAWAAEMARRIRLF